MVLPAGRVTDWMSLGVLASWVSRDAVGEAIEQTGRAAKCSDGTVVVKVARTTPLRSAISLNGGQRSKRCSEKTFVIGQSGDCAYLTSSQLILLLIDCR